MLKVRFETVKVSSMSSCFQIDGSVYDKGVGSCFGKAVHVKLLYLCALKPGNPAFITLCT